MLLKECLQGAVNTPNRVCVCMCVYACVCVHGHAHYIIILFSFVKCQYRQLSSARVIVGSICTYIVDIEMTMEK